MSFQVAEDAAVGWIWVFVVLMDWKPFTRSIQESARNGGNSDWRTLKEYADTVASLKFGKQVVASPMLLEILIVSCTGVGDRKSDGNCCWPPGGSRKTARPPLWDGIRCQWEDWYFCAGSAGLYELFCSNICGTIDFDKYVLVWISCDTICVAMLALFVFRSFAT